MRETTITLILVFSASVCQAQFRENSPVYLGTTLNGSFMKICLGNCNYVQKNPRDRLYSYKDGGLDNDMSRAQADFEEETDQMLEYIGLNIEQRLDYLDEQYQKLQGEINDHLSDAIEEDGTILVETQRINMELDALIDESDNIMDIQDQAEHHKYLVNVHATKALADQAMKRAMYKRSLSGEAKADLKLQRERLLDESSYHASDPALAVAVISSNINATSNLIFDLLAVDPAVSNNPTLAGIGLIKSALNDAIITGDLDADKLQVAFAKAYLLDALTAGRPLLQIAKAFYSYGESIAALTQLPSDHKALKAEIKKQLDMIDQQLWVYNESIQEADAVIELHRHIIQSIDDYLDLNGLTDDLRYEPLNAPLPIQNISPYGFNFQAFNLSEAVYNAWSSDTEKDLIYEDRKNQIHYAEVIERFGQYTSRGDPDPVFSSLFALESNERKARMCMEFAGDMEVDFEAIKARYPKVSETIIYDWIEAAKQTRYEALGYLPLSDETFRFTPVDLDAMRSEMTQTIEYIQNLDLIPYYACNIYTGLLSNRIYGVSENVFKNKNGQWLTANQLAAKASVSGEFSLIGKAVDQEVLDQASYFATIGQPVIAIYYNPNPNGHGHVNMILPGLNTGNAFESRSWQRWVPFVTNYSLTLEGECKGCFTEGKLSEAFLADKAPYVMIYIIK